MIDINIIRNDKEIVKENIKKKYQEHKLPLVDEILELDEKVRKLKIDGDNLRQERNSKSNLIGSSDTSKQYNITLHHNYYNYLQLTYNNFLFYYLINILDLLVQ